MLAACSLASLFLSSACLAAVWFLLNFSRLRWTFRRRGHHLPPGPPGWPLVGNLFDLRADERLWHVFRRWTQSYGDVVFVQVLNQPWLVISSADVALDLLEKRSSIYSDRARSTIDHLTGWEFSMALMPYGDQWRSVKRYMRQYFNSVAVSKYHAKQTHQVHAFLRRCLAQVGRQLDPLSVRLTLAATIIDVVYGLEIKSMDDSYMCLAAEALDLGVESRNPAKYWVDYMPFLKYVPVWVPGTASIRLGKRCRPLLEEMINRPFNTVKEGKTANPSMVLDIITQLNEKYASDPARRSEEERYAKYAAGIAYSGGSDTTYSLIQTFLCQMALNPDIQMKAQEELALAVGPERLPTFNDYDALPYVRAILLECARWLPPLPFAFPHCSIADDYYGGYFIPEGTNVFVNVWHILRNPEDYPEPERFNPDRFMKDGKLNGTVRDPMRFIFGFGRRVCPGRYFTQDIAFLIMASSLHAFDVVPPPNENGTELRSTPQMSNGAVSYPEPLQYTLKPRSEVAEKLVRATAL